MSSTKSEKVRKGKKILIVDDEKSLTTVFSLKLKRAGFVTDTASDGTEALEKIHKHGFDLIILDLMMPKKNGFDTLEDLKKDGSTTPVIVASNLSQDEDVVKAKKLGAKDYFIKSNTSLDEVVKKVTQQFL